MCSKELILFFDSGDTLIDESTEVRDDKDIVLKAEAIPGAKETVRTLAAQGYTLVLVADGEAQSFKNALTQNGLYDCFSAIICSELIKSRKPNPAMFRAAMGALNLNEGEQRRIAMVGNNLARDIRGANQLGITSIFCDWSPRYRKMPENAAETPCFTIHAIDELIDLAGELEQTLENGNLIKKAPIPEEILYFSGD